jgi:hypothetical protein
VGRRSKASEARVEALLAALKAGNTRTAAAGHAEIDRTTLHRWLERDAGLRARVEKAEADAEVRFAAQVAQAAGTDWRAGAWWLERRRSATYGRAAATSPAAGPAAGTAVLAPHPLDSLSPAELADRARAWAQRLTAEAIEPERLVTDGDTAP